MNNALLTVSTFSVSKCMKYKVISKLNVVEIHG